MLAVGAGWPAYGALAPKFLQCRLMRLATQKGLKWRRKCQNRALAPKDLQCRLTRLAVQKLIKQRRGMLWRL